MRPNRGNLFPRRNGSAARRKTARRRAIPDNCRRQNAPAVKGTDMGKKKRKKAPVQKTPAAVAQKRSPFFALPRCPECGRTVLYRTLAAKPMLFAVRCRCGAEFGCRPRLASGILWLVTLLLCLGMIRLVIAVSTDMIPVFFFTVVFVTGAFFLYPLTLRAVRRNPKKQQLSKDESQLPEKNEK